MWMTLDMGSLVTGSLHETDECRKGSFTAYRSECTRPPITALLLLPISIPLVRQHRQAHTARGRKERERSESQKIIKIFSSDLLRNFRCEGSLEGAA
jgi:hypothetical protein